MQVKELMERLAQFNDNDEVVVEIHDSVKHEDLYEFTIDAIDGVSSLDGSTFTEVRLCI